jgi:hypothetical protein
MAGNTFNPGADATIVSAATRAGMASTPGDYSKTFDSVSKNYAKTMESVSELWTTIIESAGMLAQDAVAKAGARRRTKIAIKDTPGSEDLQKETAIFKQRIEDIKSSDNPNSSENKAKIRAIKRERNIFYDKVGADFELGQQLNETVASNKFDTKGTGGYGIETINAWLASQSTGEKTGLGNHFKRSWDSDNKRIKYTMHNDPSANEMKNNIDVSKMPKDVKTNGATVKTDTVKTDTESKDTIVYGSDNKPISYTAEEIADLMTPHDPKLKGYFDKLFSNYEKRGLQVGQNWSEYEKNNATNAVSELNSTKAGLYQSIHQKYGNLPQSFHEAYTSESGLSAQAYTALTSIYGDDALKNMNIDDMSDGTSGIQQSDFVGDNATENMKRLTLALFNKGDGNHSEEKLRELKNNFDVNNIQLAYDFGKVRNPNYIKSLAGNNDGSGEFVNLDKGINSTYFQDGNDAYIGDAMRKNYDSTGKALHARESLRDGQIIWEENPNTGEGSYFAFKTKDKTGTPVPIINKRQMFKLLYKDVEFKSAFLDSDYYKSIPDWDGSMFKEEEKEESKSNKNKTKSAAIIPNSPVANWFVKKYLQARFKY